MTRFIHDQFAKDYLETLLEPFGQVKAPRRVSAEAQQIDVWFEPAPENLRGINQLGSLGKIATSPSIFEPFRNPVTPYEISDCLLKLLLVQGETKRQAKRQPPTSSLDRLPQLWILTPTASSTVLSGFHAEAMVNELPGFYSLGESLRSHIIVIHQLPRTEETLWLRVLGRNQVQKQAIDELEALSAENPFRQLALELLYTLRENLQLKQELEPEERELIMRLAPLYQQEREKLERDAKQEGMEIAKQQIAQKLLGQGMEINQIAEITGLSVEAVTQLANDR